MTSNMYADYKDLPFKGLINVLIKSVPEHNEPVTSSSHILLFLLRNMIKWGNVAIKGTLLSHFRTTLTYYGSIHLLFYCFTYIAFTL